MSQQNMSLLIVEDDSALQRQLRWSFAQYELSFADDRTTALAELRRCQPPVVLLDLGLPPDADGISAGMDALGDILRLAPETKVIVVTGNGDDRAARQAVELGAYDFYQKPIDTDTLGLIIERAFYMAGLEADNRRLRNQVEQPLAGLVSASAPMRDVVRQIEKIAPTNASALLIGDTGSGKEVLARALHRLSPRAEQAFVAINCAAIPENLLESELFGHEKGSFTGADKQQVGKIELADGGTLFLDEIGDMDWSLQVKLLRFLEQRAIERVGGRREIAVDVRLIGATHRDLQTRIAEEEFREDLYYRIAEIVVCIPPLREREDDVVMLAKHFLEKATQANGRDVRGFSQKALDAIRAYSWPGNVRELEHCINRAVILTDTRTISPDSMGFESDQTETADEPLNLREVRNNAERAAINRIMAHAAGNMSEAARLLGVSRPALYDLVKKHGLSIRG